MNDKINKRMDEIERNVRMLSSEKKLLMTTNRKMAREISNLKSKLASVERRKHIFIIYDFIFLYNILLITQVINRKIV